MRLTPLHRRLLADVLAVGAPYQLVLTDGYAVQAHGLADRLSQDLDVATEHPAAMKEIAEALTAGLTERGWQVHEVEVVPLSGRLVVTDPETGESCEVDVLKEHLWKPAVQLEFGPVLRVDDVVGTKMRALADRGYARDLIDVQAAARWFSHRDLEDLGRCHARDTFDLTELRDRLAGADWIDDAEFAAYGLDGDAIAGLRTWAQEWVGDLDRRLAAEGDYEDGRQGRFPGCGPGRLRCPGPPHVGAGVHSRPGRYVRWSLQPGWPLTHRPESAAAGRRRAGGASGGVGVPVARARHTAESVVADLGPGHDAPGVRVVAVDVGSVGSLAAGSPGEKPLQAAIADYADMALQTLLAAAHGVHDGLPADQLDDAVTRMRTDTGTRMAKLLAQTLRLWSERPADLQTIADMAHVLISALLVLTADGDQENVLPLLAQLRVGALASGT